MLANYICIEALSLSVSLLGLLWQCDPLLVWINHALKQNLRQCTGLQRRKMDMCTYATAKRRTHVKAAEQSIIRTYLCKRKMCQTLPCRVKICEPSLVLTLMHWVRGHSLVSPWLDARWNAATTETETNCGRKKFLESRFQLGLDAAPVTSRDLMQGPTNQTETKTNYGAKKCPEAVLYCASAFFGASDPLGKYWQPLIIRWAQEVQRSSCTQRKYCTDPALILAPKRNIFSKSAIICATSLKIFFCFGLL